MKTQTLLLAAALASASSLVLAAERIVFTTPVVYQHPVTYAAGVTYVAPVTYAGAMSLVEPVVLEGIVVTPKRNYTASQYEAHLLAKRMESSDTAVAARHQRQRNTWGGLVKALFQISR